MNRPVSSFLMKMLLLLFIGVLFSSTTFPSDNEKNRTSTPSLLPLESSWVDSVFNELSLNQKIGQLFMVSAYSNKGPEHTQHILRLIKKYHIGGLIFFQGAPGKQAKLTNIYQYNSDVPLMIAMDAEWGLGMRLDSSISYPRQMALGSVQDDSLIYKMGLDIGEQLRRTGVHINFAPVVDVNNNPDNPVIGSRSFGEDKYNVARKGIAYTNGLQDRRVMAVAKHFPGHGDTDRDSHKTLPVIKHDSLRIDSLELYPFKRLINNGVGGVMVAHLNIPSLIDEPNRPTTLSKNIVSNILREKLGFNGLVFTDALNMKGVTHYFDAGEIEFEALKAGNDVLLYPQDVPEAISYIKKKIRRGEISEQRINESCKRILAFKYWAGLDQLPHQKRGKDGKSVETDSLYPDLHKPEYEVTLRKLTEHSLTLLKNTNSTLPLKGPDTLKIASLTIGLETEANSFTETLDLYTDLNHYNAGTEPDITLIKELGGYNLVVAGLMGTNERPYRNYGLKEEYFEFLRQLSQRTRVVLIHFGNPYALQDKDLSNYQAVLSAYSDDPHVQHVAAQAVFGGFPVTGRLPVSIGPDYPSGKGETIEKSIRLRYTLPEHAGMSSEKLRKVDSLVSEAIKGQATPGCQIFVARNGNVVYNKSFGYHTYLKKKKVDWKDLYDIASVTKIVSTVPSIMKYYEEGRIKLDDTLGKFMPRLNKTNKSGLRIKDILTHQARLKSWIPFYQSTMETLYQDKPLISKKFSEGYPFKIGAHSYIAKNFRFKENIFSYTPSEVYSIQIADGLFQNKAYKDSVFKTIDDSELRENNEYKYSDLGYYYFYQVIEDFAGKPMEDFVDDMFYKPLGATRMTFLPLRKFSKSSIVPTENDMIFRKQLLQGYVHDPGTAMLGGVCGHAGVFSNANDLGKIMQMYLNGGTYGGKRFFEDSTLNKFTDSPFDETNGNRRGIGFDKPVSEEDKPGPTFSGISSNSFGHSGFTGTIAWADRDEKVVYIFLSNRIHPDQDNRKLIEDDVRTRIQKAIYEAIE